MSKNDIRPQFECQIRILNVKIRYSAQFECQNRTKSAMRPQFECQIRILNVKIGYSAQFECQNRILNGKIR